MLNTDKLVCDGLVPQLSDSSFLLGYENSCGFVSQCFQSPGRGSSVPSIPLAVFALWLKQCYMDKLVCNIWSRSLSDSYFLLAYENSCGFVSEYFSSGRGSSVLSKQTFAEYFGLLRKYQVCLKVRYLSTRTRFFRRTFNTEFSATKFQRGSTSQTFTDVLERKL